ncbi:hypothetical protein DFH07DRAFT_948526 [Mycena maculata]|uniref:Uncharacterized protein n=1 Tax=Mycena maculata TaxID=230809 RepID=A0AAD7KDL0_9AGAR|nr:hypothetical protein DFH07DRAFT_948526 [Mycena maculata]
MLINVALDLVAKTRASVMATALVGGRTVHSWAVLPPQMDILRPSVAQADQIRHVKYLLIDQNSALMKRNMASLSDALAIVRSPDKTPAAPFAGGALTSINTDSRGTDNIKCTGEYVAAPLCTPVNMTNLCPSVWAMPRGRLAMVLTPRLCSRGNIASTASTPTPPTSADEAQLATPVRRALLPARADTPLRGPRRLKIDLCFNQ